MGWWNDWKLRRLAKQIGHSQHGLSERFDVVSKLVELRHEPRAVELLVQILQDEENHTGHNEAVSALGEVGGPGVVEALVGRLERKRLELLAREVSFTLLGDHPTNAIVYSLEQLKDPRAIGSFVRLLDVVECRPRSRAALADFGWSPSTPEERFRDALAGKRYAEIADAGARAVGPLLEIAAHDPDDKGKAFRTLIKMRETAVGPLLASLKVGAKKPSQTTRLARSGGNHTEGATAPVDPVDVAAAESLGLVRGPIDRVLQTAAEILGIVRDPRAIGPLQAICDHPDRTRALREAAQRALRGIRDVAESPVERGGAPPVPRPLSDRSLSAPAGTEGREPRPRQLDWLGHDFDFLVFSPDGTLLAGLTTDVVLWDVRSGALLRILPRCLCLAFSPDSTLLVTGGSPIRVWDIATGAQQATIDAPASHLAFLADGTLVSLHSAIDHWDLRSGSHLKSLKPPGRTILLSADGSTGASLVKSEDPDREQLVVWDARTGAETGRVQQGDDRTRDTLSPDGRYFADAGSWPLYDVFDTRSGQLLVTINPLRIYGMPDDETPTYCLSFSPDSSLLAVCNAGGATVWNVTSGKKQEVEFLGTGKINSSRPGRLEWTQIAIAPDGRTVALI